MRQASRSVMDRQMRELPAYNTAFANHKDGVMSTPPPEKDPNETYAAFAVLALIVATFMSGLAAAAVGYVSH